MSSIKSSVSPMSLEKVYDPIYGLNTPPKSQKNSKTKAKAKAKAKGNKKIKTKKSKRVKKTKHLKKNKHLKKTKKTRRNLAKKKYNGGSAQLQILSDGIRDIQTNFESLKDTIQGNN